MTEQRHTGCNPRTDANQSGLRIKLLNMLKLKTPLPTCSQKRCSHIHRAGASVHTNDLLCIA